MIHPATFDFLRDLSANNYREWFQEHKDRYETAYANMIELAEEVYGKMIEADNLVPSSGKKTLYRIYRDVRFSKEKLPYKTHWAGGFTRATQWLRGGYYFHVEPGDQSFVAGGFWGPSKEDLLRIRKEFAADDASIRAILEEPGFKQLFGQLQGDALKTAPKGFDKEHPAIDLIRMKQFIVKKDFTDQEALSPDFATAIADTFHAMRPYLDYMSDVLTTDENGIRINQGY